jgi:hypothetical protein
MQNQANSKTEKLSRQEYNRLYYKKNKDNLLAKKKTGPRTNVRHLFSDGKLKKLSMFEVPWPRFQMLEFLLLIGLTTMMTCFLIREAASFYQDAQEGPFSAYIKAGIMEGIAILFSFSRSRILFLRWAQRVVLILLCSFTLWVMSGKIVKTSLQDTSKAHAVEQVIQDLESERTQKEALRQEFINRRWLNMARRYEKGLDQIREKLAVARHEMAGMSAPKVIMNSLGILLTFRILVLIANLICFHRIAEFINPEMDYELASGQAYKG